MNDATVWSRFSLVAKRHPNKIAVAYESEKITYDDLFHRASHLSHLISLRLKNINKPLRIAFLIEDRIHAIIAILSTLKIGAAFIPLDPEDPLERIKFIIKDADPCLLLTHQEELHKAQSVFSHENIFNLDDGTNHQTAKDVCLEEDHTPEDLAYILYTSGTSGNPKGVCQSQGNLIRHVDHYSKKLDIKESDRVSLIYTLSFSAANMDIFGALFNGATLCAYNTRRNGVQKLTAWMKHENITIFHAVPTVFKKALSHLSDAYIFNEIRGIDLGGDSLSFSDITLFRKFLNPQCKIINHLAASEISVIAQYEIPYSLKETNQLIPVGKPPAGVEIEIVDELNNPVRQGEQGKIIISSPYLAINYWKHSDLNKKYFKEDLARPGWKIFYSDDFGFFDENHDLIFVGRQGSRIKIRGQSVDMSEIEIALKKCPYIQDAVALPYFENKEAEPDSIAAHIVFMTNMTKEPIEIRKDLSQRLPQYMLPNLYMVHHSFQQTPNGKIDRRYLASLKIEHHQNVSEGPIGFLEGAIATIFKRVIKLDKFPSRKDDFFLLGGDSMGVVDLQLSLNQIVNKEVPIKEILLDSTVIGLATLLEKVANESSSPDSPLLVQLSDKGQLTPLFIVHGRAGQAPVSPNFINTLGDTQPIYAFQAKGMNGIDLPAKSIKEAALDYIREMKKIQPTGPYYLGAMCVGGYVAMLMSQMLVEKGEKVFPLLLLDPAAPPFTAPPEVLDSEDFMKKFAASARENVIRNAQQGKYQVDLTNEFRRNAAFYIAVHIVRILSRFKPVPYAGEVCMIVSDERMGPNGWGNTSKFNAVFSGEVKVYKIHGKHDEILDSKNPEFTEHLKTVLSYIRNYKL